MSRDLPSEHRALAHSFFMGVLQYGASAPAVLDDRVLSRIAALREVVCTTGQPFCVTFANVIDGHPGRTAIWLHPAIDLRIVYEAEPDPINEDELSELAAFGIGLGNVEL